MENECWYAMYVRMHHEKKTAEKLKAMGVTHYLPIQEVVRQWSDRKKKLQVVVIPMMIFVRVTDHKRISLLKDIPALTGTLIDRCTHKPAIIRDKEMESFQFMLDYSDEAVSFISGPLQKGERIKVVKGPLKGLEGELIQISGKPQVTVQLEQLGYATVEIPVGFIEKA
ncbi:UpxY family transcription antiterminator [uncultured Bacteroides sp.]|uniref:UpxY family transcription antiterminator n=1 Tax=uncultured Bacteroides sp. TaxID=162156 RepID=UPI00262F21D1|nr:UpxY family transcription antiterminator [uncultured Bacteroides sp.]